MIIPHSATYLVKTLLPELYLVQCCKSSLFLCHLADYHGEGQGGGGGAMVVPTNVSGSINFK